MGETIPVPTTTPSKIMPTSSVLYATSKHISERCGEIGEAFLACKRDDMNPRKCLDKADKVMGCVYTLLDEVHDKSLEEVKNYSRCLSYHSNKLKKCRQEEEAFFQAFPLKGAE